MVFCPRAQPQKWASLSGEQQSPPPIAFIAVSCSSGQQLISVLNGFLHHFCILGDDSLGERQAAHGFLNINTRRLKNRF